MTLQKYSLFEEQEHSKKEAIERYAREIKQLIRKCEINFTQFRPANDNNCQEILDSSTKDCLNGYREKINYASVIGMDIRLPSQGRTVAQALQAVEKEIERLYREPKPNYDDLDVQYALEEYLSHIVANKPDEICNEGNLEGIEEAVRYGIDFDWRYPNFFQIACEMRDRRAELDEAESYGIDFDIKNPNFVQIARDMEELRADQSYSAKYGCPDAAYDNYRDELYESRGN